MVVRSLLLELLIRFAIEVVVLMCSCRTAHSRTTFRDYTRTKSVVYIARCSKVVMCVMIVDFLFIISIASSHISSPGAVKVRLPILTYPELS